MKDYHKLSKDITDLLKDPDAMKGLTLQQSLRKLGYIKVSDEPIEEHIQIDLEQYAKENGYVKLEKEELVRLMHDTYEEQAKIVGWKTQESCQVKFDDLPEANKKVMYAVADAIINARGVEDE